MLRMRRRCDCRLLFGAAAACILWRSWTGTADAFVPTAGQSNGSRRALLSAAVPALLGTPAAVSAFPAGITDPYEYINRRKRELIPYMKQGIDYLEGHDIDERMMKFLPKMVKKMEAYAGIQSNDDAPDKTVYKLLKHVKAFEKAVKNNDKPLALEAFQKYQNDMPQGLARFDLKDPVTYEGPKVDLPAAT
mmetsp:Transcript_60767/g.113622  ORF Transcript_60767/g.113622 Transcript_60767/m.113622 type:complete len:191 (-) Transcript_60767:80-652(-)